MLRDYKRWKHRITTQDKGINKVSMDYGCYGCGSSDHWIKDCPWKQAQNTSQQGARFFQGRVQSPNLLNKNYSGKQPPRTQSQKKGKGKGKGKNKGNYYSRRLFQKGKGKGKGNNKVRPAARALDWGYNPDFMTMRSIRTKTRTNIKNTMKMLRVMHLMKTIGGK